MPTDSAAAAPTDVPAASRPVTDDGAVGRAGPLRSWLLRVYPCLFLVILAFPLVEAWSRDGWARLVGVVGVLGFCAWYGAGLLSPRFTRTAASRWAWIGGLVALSVLLATASGSMGFGVGMSFVACGGAVVLPSRPGLGVAVLAGAVVVPAAAYGGLGALAALAVGGWVTLVGAMVWAGVTAGRQRDEVVRAREERAELAVELERTRLARDLHDILGHSLTVVTIKAELAGRLVDVDPERAKAEIADLERLARDALADVRTTVSDYRRLSLPAELAGARRALEAAGITAHLPSAADEVAGDLRDLFAWVVREGVTNVVRHSGATTCTITLTPTGVEVRDDGRGAAADAPGNGLVGLGERARQVGARLETDAIDDGFVLRAVADHPYEESGKP